MHIVFCDDDVKFAENMVRELSNISDKRNENMTFDIIKSGDEIISLYENKKLPVIDVLFLDVEMKGRNGIEVKQALKDAEDVKRIIFLTAHNEAMPMAFGIKVANFLTKPIDAQDIYSQIMIMKDELSNNICIKYYVGNKEYFFYKDKLVYIESYREYTLLYFIGQKEAKKVRIKISYWAKRLRTYNFVQIHKGYIVNMDYIERMMATEVTIKGVAVPLSIGRKYKINARDQYNEYMIKVAKKRLK